MLCADKEPQIRGTGSIRLRTRDICLSAAVSYTAAAVLIPLGAVTLVRGLRTDRRYAALFALPLLFGLQQLFEGLVWTAGGLDDQVAVVGYAMAYMFFSWLAWPVWVPIAVFLIEGSRRKPLFLVMAILGGMLGGLQYVPYFAHEGWLSVRFLPNAVVYESTELLDFIIGREGTYMIYMAIVAGSLLLSRDRNVKVFGLLVFAVMAVTYAFFAYAYVSVFCFGGAVMSLYLVWMAFGGGFKNDQREIECAAGSTPA